MERKEKGKGRHHLSQREGSRAGAREGMAVETFAYIFGGKPALPSSSIVSSPAGLALFLTFDSFRDGACVMRVACDCPLRLQCLTSVDFEAVLSQVTKYVILDLALEKHCRAFDGP